MSLTPAIRDEGEKRASVALPVCLGHDEQEAADVMTRVRAFMQKLLARLQRGGAEPESARAEAQGEVLESGDFNPQG